MKTKILIVLLVNLFIKIGYSQNYIPSIMYGEDTILYVCPYDNYDTMQWGPYGVDITTGNGAEDGYYGAPNTSAIVEQLGDNGGVPYPANMRYSYCIRLYGLVSAFLGRISECRN
jgi:hypothetical protein